MVCWLLEVRERVCRIEGAVARLRTEVDELRKEVARLKQKVRYEELLAKVRYQELVLAGALHRPASDAAYAVCS
jgi:predicted nuclease with TOPRIM domain